VSQLPTNAKDSMANQGRQDFLLQRRPVTMVQCLGLLITGCSEIIFSLLFLSLLFRVLKSFWPPLAVVLFAGGSFIPLLIAYIGFLSLRRAVFGRLVKNED
jgi:hypothetical protein